MADLLPPVAVGAARVKVAHDHTALCGVLGPVTVIEAAPPVTLVPEYSFEYKTIRRTCSLSSEWKDDLVLPLNIRCSID
jgi:hypothetical protein